MVLEVARIHLKSFRLLIDRINFWPKLLLHFRNVPSQGEEVKSSEQQRTRLLSLCECGKRSTVT